MPAIERIIPVLTYQDIPAAHEFLVHAFGFVAGGVDRTPDGQPIHGEVRAGDATIRLHRVTAEHHLDSPLAVDVANSGLVVYVDDVARTTSALVQRVPASTASRSISRMVSVNMERGTWRVTDGGLQHQ